MKTKAFLFGLALLGAATGAQAEEQPLRLVMNNELQTLDPIVSPSVVTRAFGSMVWDTLVAPDSHGVMRPQMLEGWQVSEDRLTWTFTLRPGLEWTDGTPVTAEDCIASIRRWGGRDGLGRQLMGATASLDATGPNTFVMRLNRPFALVLEALGKTATLVPYMMPARLASTPGTQQITEIVGSGPFVFRREEWRPGDRVVFYRNARYRPRAEPADGLAGGKVVHFERTEFVSIPDHSTKVSALLQGEIDYIERAPLDFIESLRRDRRVVVTAGRGGGEVMGALTFNQTIPPFNDVRVRRAAQQAIEQSDVVASTGLPADMVQQHCYTFYMCGTPYATEAGTESLRTHSMARARAMLRESGYNNEPIVVLHARDSALIDPVAMVAVDQMRRAGFNIDLVSTDWSTVAQRRTNRSPVAQGGWNVVPLVWTGFDMPNPIVNPAMVYNCANVYPGWWCDQRQVPLLRQFSEEPDMARRRELAAQLQVLAHDNVNVVLLGQFAGPAVYRADLNGLLEVGFPVLWNIQPGAALMAERWAAVTGAAGGIGTAVCLQLAQQGLAVLMLDVQEGPLAASAERVRAAGGRAELLALDVLDPTAPAAALARAESLGRVDVLVNLAGGSGPRPIRTIEEMEDEIWDHVMALNLTSAFRFSRAFVPGMRARGYGRIMNVSSTLARGRKGPVTTQGARLAYSTSKAALLGFTAQLAKDEAAHGITVNAVMPSLILAEQGSRIRDRFEALTPEHKEGMLRDFPTGRAGEAHEVAAVIGFLCSEAASYVTGVGLPVDGGFL